MIDEPGSQHSQELMSVNVCRSGREAEAQAGSKGEVVGHSCDGEDEACMQQLWPVSGCPVPTVQTPADRVL